MRRNTTKVQQILQDLEKKMVFIVGPRQVGKTWLSKHIAESFEHTVYLNYDNLQDREDIENFNWPANTQLVILDELHKMPEWKNYLKIIMRLFVHPLPRKVSAASPKRQEKLSIFVKQLAMTLFSLKQLELVNQNTLFLVW